MPIYLVERFINMVETYFKDTQMTDISKMVDIQGAKMITIIIENDRLWVNVDDECKLRAYDCSFICVEQSGVTTVFLDKSIIPVSQAETKKPGDWNEGPMQAGEHEKTVMKPSVTGLPKGVNVVIERGADLSPLPGAEEDESDPNFE
jgi:hypothetical protein